MFARWSNQSSFIHRLDARVKLILLLAFVISLALLRVPSPLQLACCFLGLSAIAWTAHLPVARILRMSLLVVPFIGIFSAILYLTGENGRAWFILAKSYLSALSVLLCVSVTPLSQLLSAARFFRTPALLVEITQLVYRYVFVLGSEARVMQIAFAARGGRAGRRAVQASSGMIAVLFARSYEKAAIVHQSMCGRGFTGVLPRQEFTPLRMQDIIVLSAGLLLAASLHLI